MSKGNKTRVMSYDPTSSLLTLTDKDRSEWLDGIEMIYELSKDDRPDFNPYEYFDNYHQGYYKLQELARMLPLNKVPQEIVEGLAELEKLNDLCEKYTNHLLGLLIREKDISGED